MAVEAYHAGYIRTALIQNGDVVTPYQVLAVAYLNATGASGGFFPNGVNGKIQYSS